MKPNWKARLIFPFGQPPSGGCVLKLFMVYLLFFFQFQPPSGGCVLKPFYSPTLRYGKHPAAFGRLCVETLPYRTSTAQTLPQPPSGGCVLKLNTMKIFEAPEIQPPSGGCVLKHPRDSMPHCLVRQPPSGGCVLKHERGWLVQCRGHQPPSGGCVLKRAKEEAYTALMEPAAFGRLCVETSRP